MSATKGNAAGNPFGVATRACIPGTVAVVIISMFIIATMLAMPICSMQIYDRVLSSRNETTLVMLALIVLIFLILYGILECARSGVWELRGGETRIDGAALTQWDRNKLGKSVGYLPQDVELSAGTVADNVARLSDVDSRAVVAAAKAAGAHDVILRLPQGYDTPIGEGGLSLSGSMRQRVGLALAQMKAAGRTVIVVTHRPQLLAHVEKVMVMSFGAALAFGERDDVIARMRGNTVAAVQQPRIVSAA